METAFLVGPGINSTSESSFDAFLGAIAALLTSDSTMLMLFSLNGGSGMGTIGNTTTAGDL